MAFAEKKRLMGVGLIFHQETLASEISKGIGWQVAAKWCITSTEIQKSYQDWKEARQKEEVRAFNFK